MTATYVAAQPVDDFGFIFSTVKYSASLVMSTDTELTVPSQHARYKAIIKCEADGVVWVALNATAAVPAGGTFATVSSEMVPVNGVLCREVKAADVLHFITAGSGIDVSVVFYALNNLS